MALMRFSLGLTIKKKSRVFITALCLACVAASLMNQEAFARKRHRRHKEKRTVINEPKLWARLGGAKVASDITDEWLRLNLADSRLADSFGKSNGQASQIKLWRKILNEELCEIADGPCAPGNEASAPQATLNSLGNDEPKFLAFAENLQTSLQKLKIHEREKNEILGGLGDTRGDDTAPADHSTTLSAPLVPGLVSTPAPSPSQPAPDSSSAPH